MCGRTVCSLCKEDLQKVTQQYTLGKELPNWVEKYSWQNYVPNYNLSPSQISPVLVMEDTVNSELEDADIALCPMRWGFIPNWHPGLVKDYKLKTNNCCYDTILERPIYKNSLIRGRRCVVLADGYYEWRLMSDGKKQPYFFYLPKESDKDIATGIMKNESGLPDVTDSSCRHLLTMAGIFDVLKSEECTELYSYAIVTVESSENISFIHKRMPVLLDGIDQVKMWLDHKTVPYKEAVANIAPLKDLSFYPVSSEVNTSTNNSVNCMTPVTLKEEKMSQKTLMAWLTPDAEPEEECPQNKRAKLDD